MECNPWDFDVCTDKTCALHEDCLTCIRDLNCAYCNRGFNPECVEAPLGEEDSDGCPPDFFIFGLGNKDDCPASENSVLLQTEGETLGEFNQEQAANREEL